MTSVIHEPTPAPALTCNANAIAVAVPQMNQEYICGVVFPV